MFLYGVLILNQKPPPWLIEYRAWINGASPIQEALIRLAFLIMAFIAILGGLNLAFGFRPFGVDYHRPWTYFNAIIPAVIIDFLSHCLGDSRSHKETHSAVYDDWLLWDRRDRDGT